MVNIIHCPPPSSRELSSEFCLSHRGKKHIIKQITGGIEFSFKLVVIQYAQTNGPNGDGVSLLWVELNGTGPLRVNDRIIKV